MIRILPGDARSFEGGVCLQASSCAVTEEANGQYCLDMVMPTDDELKRHRLLSVGCLIVAPTPPHSTPFSHIITTQGLVKRYKAVGSAYQAQVVAGKYRDTGGTGEWIYTYKTETRYSSVPVYKTSALTEQIASVANGDLLTLIELETGCIFCACSGGAVGYVKDTQCAYYDQTTGDVVTIVREGAAAKSEQPFRVVRVTKTAPGSISVYAEHLYFDAAARSLPKIEAVNMSLSDLCSALNGGEITFIPGMTGYITGTYDAQNAVSIMQDACEQLSAQIVRDGANAYILPADTSENTAELTTGVNISALSEETDAGELVTRVIPVISGADGTAIDSPHIGDYPLVYEMRVTCATQADGQAQADQLFADGEDLPAVTVNVSCQTGSIDRLAVFDKAHVTDQRLEIDVTGQINRVDFDAITGHNQAISIGSAKKRMTVSVFGGVGGTWQKTT